MQELESSHKVREFLDWHDQTPNQRMALQGSRDGSLATLDLSEASDRFSNQLVRDLLSNHPHLLEAVMSSRSTRADVNGQVIELAKFASMGSALCFPIESIVFLTIVISRIARERRVPVSQSLLKQLRGKVRVYGDDIIVPAEHAVSVIEELEAFGLKVNSRKSFWKGKFRESCGKEYYDGFDVSIVRVRQVFPTSRKHVTELESTVSLRNQLFEAGYEDSVQWLDNLIEKLIPFPVGMPSSAGLVRHAYIGYQAERMHPDYQYPLVRGVVVKHSLRSDRLDGAGALMKFFLKRGPKPVFDREHLLRAGRPIKSTLKYRWFRPF